jgi:uncharacterized RDD family membrane protein YckC
MFDWVIKAAVLLGAAVAALVVLVLVGGEVAAARIAVLVFLIILIFIFVLGFDIYYEVRHSGQTPGKKHAGIRVIREGGAPLDFRSSCIRNVLAAADFLPGFYLLGGLLILLTGRHQRLGDLAAGTIVIRERVIAPPADVVKEIEPLAEPDIAFTAGQLASCTPQDHYILRSFFQRYQEMEFVARQQLACNLALEFLRKTDYPLNANVLDGRLAETFLASLYRDLEKLG